MIEITSVRHAYPENAGFFIDRPHGLKEFTFLHFYNSVELLVGNKRVQTLPHAVVLYGPDQMQYFYSREPLVHDWFHFTGDLSDLELEDFAVNELFYPSQYGFITEIVAQMEKEFFSALPNRALLLELLTKNLLIQLDRNQNQSSSAVSSEIEERLRAFRGVLFSSLKKYWTVEAMARQVGFSQSHFFAVYKKIFGISPTADLINARINAGKHMLLFQNKKIDDIAADLGYQNTTHFIRQFKSVTGMTPSAYRKNA